MYICGILIGSEFISVNIDVRLPKSAIEYVVGRQRILLYTTILKNSFINATIFLGK